MSAEQTRYSRKADRRLAMRIDPNRAHDFVENDHDLRCWRCEQKRSSYIHDPRR